MRTAAARHAWLSAWLVLAVVLLAGCASLGLPTAETFNQRLAVAYGSVTAVRSSALTLLQGGQITAEDAANVQAQADSVRSGLDVARSLSGVDLEAAEGRLDAAVVALQALQRYLETQR